MWQIIKAICALKLRNTHSSSIPQFLNAPTSHRPVNNRWSPTLQRLCLLRISIIYPAYFQQQCSLLRDRCCQHVTKHWCLNILALRVQLGGSIRGKRTSNLKHFMKVKEGGWGVDGEHRVAADKRFVVLTSQSVGDKGGFSAHWKSPIVIVHVDGRCAVKSFYVCKGHLKLGDHQGAEQWCT